MIMAKKGYSYPTKKKIPLILLLNLFGIIIISLFSLFVNVFMEFYSITFREAKSLPYHFPVCFNRNRLYFVDAIVVQYSPVEGRGGACSSRIFIKHSKRSYTQLAYYGNGQVTNVSHKRVGAGAHDSPLHINGFLGSSKAPTPTKFDRS